MNNIQSVLATTPTDYPVGTKATMYMDLEFARRGPLYGANVAHLVFLPSGSLEQAIIEALRAGHDKLEMSIKQESWRIEFKKYDFGWNIGFEKLTSMEPLLESNSCS